MSETTDAAAEQAGGTTHPPLTDAERAELLLHRLRQGLHDTSVALDDFDDGAVDDAARAIAIFGSGLLDSAVMLIDGILAGDFGEL